MRDILSVVAPPDVVVCVLVRAYFDETGTDGQAPAIGVGGYVLRPKNARSLEQRWARVLKANGLPHFHMVDCAHGNEAFDGMPVEQRIQIQTALFRLIVDCADYCAIAVAPAKASDQSEESSLYAWCASRVMEIMWFYCTVWGKPFSLSLFYEQGHSDGGIAQRSIEGSLALLKQHSGERGLNVGDCAFSFVPKAASGMVQAADAIMWQQLQYVRGTIEGRRLRADHKVLLKVPTQLAYVFPYQGRFEAGLVRGENLEAPDVRAFVRGAFSGETISDEALSILHDPSRDLVSYYLHGLPDPSAPERPPIPPRSRRLPVRGRSG